MKAKTAMFLPVFLGASILIAAVLAPFASSLPDGLERVAEDAGFKDRDRGSVLESPMADYQAPVTAGGKVSTALAGVLGTFLVFAVVVLAARTMKRRGSGADSRPVSRDRSGKPSP
ncbi:MAG: PDGLE domain-containing protein [Pseudomonadota bacterium]